jgi:uncharacterized protein
VDNPFRYGDIATGEYFAGRERELAELERDLRSGQNVVIISPRRYGKTSLVRQAIEELRRDNVLVAYIDLFLTPTKEDLAGHLADAIHSGMVAPVERAWRKTAELFTKLPLRPKITLDDSGKPSFEFAAGEQQTHDVDRTIEELLKMPARVAQSRKRKVALVMDEFQEVVEIDEHLPATMRAIFQTQPEVSHVFLGSKRHLMRRVFHDHNQPMYKMAKPVVLEAIDRETFAKFIQNRFVESGRKITEEAVNRILDFTGCHPHDTQELCHFTWTQALAETGPAMPETVDRALTEVIRAEAARYTDLWDALPPSQRLLLVAMSTAGVSNSGDEGLYSEEYRSRHRLGTSSTVQRAVKSLVEKDLLETHPYRVPDPFLRAWLARMVATS